MRYQRVTTKPLREVICLELPDVEFDTIREAIKQRERDGFKKNNHVTDNLFQAWKNLETKS